MARAHARRGAGGGGVYLDVGGVESDGVGRVADGAARCASARARGGEQDCEGGARCEPAVVLHFDVAEGAIREQDVVASVEIQSTAGNTTVTNYFRKGDHVYAL